MNFDAKVEVFGNTETLARRFIEVLQGEVAYAIEHRASASVAFSRPTPQDVFEEVGRSARLPRGRVQILQVDERHTNKDTDDRNAKLLHDHLESLIDDNAFLPMQRKLEESLSTCVKYYDRELEHRLGSPPVVDFVHLGLGEDGHTASLIPGDPVLAVKDKWVATTKAHKGFRRLTMTYPVLNVAKLVVFVVSGREKAEAVERVLRGDKTAPAARIENGNVLMLLDQEAASRL